MTKGYQLGTLDASRHVLPSSLGPKAKYPTDPKVINSIAEIHVPAENITGTVTKPK